ncbi:MAG: hypothetical protein J6N15_01680, partial [Ruminiclostridium sp.]|nr:hypothetical protein [Ruminiclostridium sp.]
GHSYRRFTFFLVLHEVDYDLVMNKGVLEGTRVFEQYMIYKGIRGNMRKIADRAGSNYELYNMVTRKALKPVTDKHAELEDKLQHEQQGTDEEILAEFADVGTIPPQEE